MGAHGPTHPRGGRGWRVGRYSCALVRLEQSPGGTLGGVSHPRILVGGQCTGAVVRGVRARRVRVVGRVAASKTPPSSTSRRPQQEKTRGEAAGRRAIGPRRSGRPGIGRARRRIAQPHRRAAGSLLRRRLQRHVDVDGRRADRGLRASASETRVRSMCLDHRDRRSVCGRRLQAHLELESRRSDQAPFLGEAAQR